MGFRIDAELNRWGWYPVGGGEVICRIAPGEADHGDFLPNAVQLLRRGALQKIVGRAVAANLPAHIPQRMTDRARAAFSGLGIPVEIEAQCVTAACPGAGVFLLAKYEEVDASFSALGRRGKPAEAVADEAVARCANITHRAPRSNLTLRINCCCLWRSQRALPPSLRRGQPAIS